MVKKASVIFGALLLLFQVVTVAGELNPKIDTRLSFRYLSVNDGLSQNSVSSILQMADGRILIGTYDGLNFFDGYDIHAVRHASGQRGGLANNRIVCLAEAADSSIWIGLDGGIMCYDPRTDRYVDYTPQLGIPELKKVRTIFEERSGTIWIGHEKGVILAQPAPDGGYTFVAASGFEALDVNCITEDQRGNIWLGTSQGLYLCEAGGHKKRSLRLISEISQQQVRYVECDPWGVLWVSHNHGIATSTDGKLFSELHLPDELRIQAVCTIRDRKDHLWVGSNTEGIYSLELEFPNRVTSIDRYAKSDLFGRISDNDISCLCLDRSGVLWAGTRRGVNHAPTAAPQFQTFKPLLGKRYTELGYDGQHINALFIDADEKLWINTFKGSTYRYDFRSGVLEDLSASVTGNSISRIIQSSNGTIWIAAQEGVYRLDRLPYGRFRRSQLHLPGIPADAPQRYRYFLDLCEDEHGDIWIATMDGLIRHNPESGRSITYTIAHGLASNSTYSLLSDRKNGLIWAGSADNGLSKIRYTDTDPGIDVEVLRQGSGSLALSDNHIWCLHMTKDGTVWIGTDAGLNRLTVLDGTITASNHILTPELENAKIVAITEDLSGDLWLNGSQGLFHYKPSSGHVKRYVSDDGLQSNTWTEGAAISKNGWIFVGGINGINYFNPNRFSTDPYPGTPFLSELKIFGQRILPGREYDGHMLLQKPLNSTRQLELNYNQNSFTIEFTSDQHVNPSKNSFRYRLDGYDTEWTTVGSERRFATYTRLPKGRYTFRLGVSNGDDVWDENERTLTIIVHPAPWATWWAYLIYLVLATALLTAAVFYLTARQRWRRKLFMQQIEQEKARELSEMKLGFYTNITHELRTPLALITAPLKDLEERNGLDEYVSFRLGLIRRNVNKLLKLINQLLEIRRVSAQNLPLKISCYNLAYTVREVVRSFGSMSEQTGIMLHFEAPQTLPDAWFDLDKIEKILQNLISNAYKFTPEQGDIHVRLAVETHDKVRYACISVQDSGIGIPSADLPRIFDLFFHSTPLNGVSSGVGLSFSKALIELHQGQITVSSKEGQGSLFIIRFPIDRHCYPEEQIVLPDKSSHPLIEKPDRPASGPDDRKYLVLIIEDNPDMNAYIVSCLESQFRTAVAFNGEEGLALAQKLKPDVVICDLMMPVMDGIEFTCRMKSNPRTNFIPIIIHSVKEDQKSIREALTAGAQEYIIKPFEAENLNFRISNLLSSREHFARKLRSETITNPTPVELPSDDEQLLQKMSSIVEANIQNPLFDIEYLAKELHMSRMQLYRRMQRVAGRRTVSEIIRDIRIKRAAQLLASGGMRVNEVMIEVGMNNQYRFTKYFQEMYGMTPKKYIQVHQADKTTDLTES